MQSTCDEILILTLNEAHRYAGLHENEFIRRALKIRSFAARRCKLQASELDIPIVDDEASLYHGQRHLPRFMNYQVDVMMNFVIDAHRKAVLKYLKSLIFGKDVITAWYEVYLLIYLLLSTIEFAWQWQLKYSTCLKDTVRSPTCSGLLFDTADPNMLQRNYTGIDFVTRSNLQEWEYSAEILIAHFRCVMRGQMPFSDHGKTEESYARAGLDEQSIAYVRKVITLVESRGMYHPRQSPGSSVANAFLWS